MHLCFGAVSFFCECLIYWGFARYLKWLYLGCFDLGLWVFFVVSFTPKKELSRLFFYL